MFCLIILVPWIGGFMDKSTPIHLFSAVSMTLLASVATPWVFSQDLGFFDRILGSWVFS